MKGISLTFASFALAGLTSAACSVSQTEAPSLTGPSEFALSVSVSASPDSLSQDGRSNSTISVTARDANGRALSNLPFRLDMLVDGQQADYGTLSSRNVVTGADGRATAVYTAPPAPPVGANNGACVGSSASVPLGGRCVQVVATAVGSDFSAAGSRSVEIHLIPTGVIVPTSATPVASFSIVPAAPTANENVQFDATKSCASALNSSGVCAASSGTITTFAWTFGDGTTGSGRTTSHAFARQQTYLVTLTVTNDVGLSASTTQSVQVGAGSVPAPAIVFSPTTPAPAQPVYFDGTTSKPGAGHNIVRYVWNWGDGTAFSDSSAPTAAHTYAAAGTYIVTLTVADETGQTASVTTSVKIATPAP
jgi:PKD repeat protein